MNLICAWDETGVNQWAGRACPDHQDMVLLMKTMTGRQLADEDAWQRFLDGRCSGRVTTEAMVAICGARRRLLDATARSQHAAVAGEDLFEPRPKRSAASAPPQELVGAPPGGPVMLESPPPAPASSGPPIDVCDFPSLAMMIISRHASRDDGAIFANELLISDARDVNTCSLGGEHTAHVLDCYLVFRPGTSRFCAKSTHLVAFLREHGLDPSRIRLS